jgi:hypothetical protein
MRWAFGHWPGQSFSHPDIPVNVPLVKRVAAIFKSAAFAHAHYGHCHLALLSLYDVKRRFTMLALQPIDTDAPAFRAEPISQDEAAALFRAAQGLFGKWGLTDEQAATLLDMPLRSYRRWKAEGPGRVSRDGRARLSNLMGIHKALRIIFAEPQRGYAWVRAANAAFGGASALDVMFGGELTDIMRVRRYLDAERGGW